MSDDKTYIIDPLTCICKLALLNFLPIGTKLSINAHVLQIQVTSYYQCIERFKNGDTRYDISNLNLPLIKAIKWYILKGPEKMEMDDELDNNFRIIASFAIKGLHKLQNYTYEKDINIKVVLQYFINLLRDALNNTWNEDNIIKIENENILSDKIKHNFEPHTINAITKMLIDADKIEAMVDNVNALIECSHKILINRDINFVKLMKNINTTL